MVHRNKSIGGTIKRFFHNESGATAIEYGLLAAILSVGIITGADGIGSIITSMWDGLASDIAAS